MLKETYMLSNQVAIYKIGFGTWQIPNGQDTYQAVKEALEVGYRHIDTAQGYGNEESVGRAVKDSGLNRKDIFITTKLESHIKNYDDALKALYKSLKALDMEYIDLVLIHAPWPWSEIGKDCNEGNVEAWKALETFYNEGKARSIGVSNFEPEHIQYVIDRSEIIPHVNQIGYFIGLDQSKTIDYCKKNNIFIEAYSPLGIGYLLDNQEIQDMAVKYNKTAAQICIRYLLQKGTAPLPKSVHKHRMIENADVEFVISNEDMNQLDQIKGDPRRWE
jgi:diketogulonate reductase-like aldo/keto reductase